MPLAALLIAGCFGRTPPAPAPTPDTTAKPTVAPAPAAVEATTYPITLTDQSETAVTLAAAPERIVSLAPQHTELLFALGAGERVVGVTTYCNVPEEAKSREQVGGFVGSSISLERVVRLKPDLVLANGVIQEEVRDALRKLEIAVLDWDPRSWAELQRGIGQIAAAVNRPADGARLIADMDRRLAAVRSRKAAAAARPRTFYMVWDEPLRTVGGQSYLDEVLREAGAEPMFADLPAQYPTVSLETVLKRDPQVILLPRTHDVTPDDLRRRPGWDATSAVKTGRVYLIDDDLTARCGPRLIQAIEAIADCVHRQPEAETPETGKSDPEKAEAKP